MVQNNQLIPKDLQTVVIRYLVVLQPTVVVVVDHGTDMQAVLEAAVAEAAPVATP